LWGKLHKNYFIIYLILRNNSNDYMPPCSIVEEDKSMEKRGWADYRYLAITTT